MGQVAANKLRKVQGLRRRRHWPSAPASGGCRGAGVTHTPPSRPFNHAIRRIRQTASGGSRRRSASALSPPTRAGLPAAEDVEDDASKESDRPVVPAAEPFEVRGPLYQPNDDPNEACHCLGCLGLVEDDEHAQTLVADELVLGTRLDVDRRALFDRDLLALHVERAAPL